MTTLTQVRTPVERDGGPFPPSSHDGTTAAGDGRPAGRRRRAKYSTVPDWLFDVGLSARCLSVAAALDRYADSGGQCWPKRRTIAADLGCSVDTVDRSIRRLVAVGYLTRAARFSNDGGQRSNAYRLHYDRVVELVEGPDNVDHQPEPEGREIAHDEAPNAAPEQPVCGGGGPQHCGGGGPHPRGSKNYTRYEQTPPLVPQEATGEPSPSETGGGGSCDQQNDSQSQSPTLALLVSEGSSLSTRDRRSVVATMEAGSGVARALVEKLGQLEAAGWEPSALRSALVPNWPRSTLDPGRLLLWRARNVVPATPPPTPTGPSVERQPPCATCGGRRYVDVDPATNVVVACSACVGAS